jgi:Carbohydrate-binding family 9
VEAEVTGNQKREAKNGPPELVVPLLLPTQRLVSIPSIELRDATSGGQPRLRTAVRVGVRGGTLLVRFDGRDDGTVATLRHRDGALWTEDVYEVFLTPLDPPVVYFEFEINPLGALFDARVESPNLVRATMNVDVSWNLPGLSGVSRVRPRRWSAVVKIPLASLVGGVLPLPPGEGRGEGAASRLTDLWRANFYRVDRGARDEFSAWAPTGRDPADFHDAAKFGRLRLPEIF